MVKTVKKESELDQQQDLVITVEKVKSVLARFRIGSRLGQICFRVTG